MIQDSPIGGIPIRQSTNAYEAVVLGAGLYACKLYGSTDLCPDLQIKDIAPLTYGIGVNGEMSVIVDRNTPIPVTRTYTTICGRRNQQSIRVFEGDAERVRDNRMLSEVLLPLRDDPRDQSALQVTFTFSNEFILSVRNKVFFTEGGNLEVQLDSSDIQNSDIVEESRRAEKRLAEADQEEVERLQL